MDRAQKEIIVQQLGKVFTDSGVVVVSRYTGLTVAEMEDFRTRMRVGGGFVRIAKNKLAKIAVSGTSYDSIKKFLNDMTVLSFSEDPVTAAKITYEFSIINPKLIILGGAMGTMELDSSGVKTVAALPSREELIASVVGCIISPSGGIAATIGAPAAAIASILETIKDKAA